ncbi:HAD family hydrolase [Stigmatella sp. ncwal1]|uniref:HAD family hydrolase n=1 Tax=Stigmatella ashevillensis TaxID=2995309 RepID=A0ABT5DIM1_9BACT|nr:HAD family hydrolase [Stigmatella ashevillena]MDC0712623.1 HAD family hydrolase [Stigmatella ashevillena]
MGIGCVVLDFDGTFTDVAAEGAPFVRHFKHHLVEVLGRDAASVEAAWREEEAAVLAGAHAFGWDIGGRTVAPATADPYLLSNCVARQLMNRYGVMTDQHPRDEALQSLYREAYKLTGTAFKPEAKEVLEALLATGLPVWVVTNAHTDLVDAKLDRLAPKGRERLKVKGDARKYLIQPPAASDARFASVPETLSFGELLPRPVYLRRGLYYEALSDIWETTGTGPESTLVAGDIYELDLALPAVLGAHVQFVARDNALPYELKAMDLLGPRGGTDRSLRAILPRLQG